MQPENVDKFEQVIKYYRNNPDKWVEDYTGSKLFKHQKLLLKWCILKYKLKGER